MILQSIFTMRAQLAELLRLRLELAIVKVLVVLIRHVHYSLVGEVFSSFRGRCCILRCAGPADEVSLSGGPGCRRSRHVPSVRGLRSLVHHFLCSTIRISQAG